MDTNPALTVNDYLDEWLVLLHTRVRRSTRATYQRMVDIYVRPHIGEVPLAELTSHRLDRLYVDLLTGGGRRGGRLARGTITHVHAVLRTALAAAVDHELIPENVACRAHVPKYDPEADLASTQLPIWDGDQTRRFLELSAEHQLHDLWRVALGTGMRRGELLGLRWSEVDLASGQLRVSAALTQVDGVLRLGPPKTGRPRTLSLDEGTLAAINRQSQTMDTYGHGLVFTRPDHSPWPPTIVTDRWRGQWPRLARSGVPRIRLHATRHVHATLLLSAGVPIKVVSERLGHSTIAMTMDTYARVFPAMDRDAAAAIGRALMV